MKAYVHCRLYFSIFFFFFACCAELFGKTLFIYTVLRNRIPNLIQFTFIIIIVTFLFHLIFLINPVWLCWLGWLRFLICLIFNILWLVTFICSDVMTFEPTSILILPQVFLIVAPLLYTPITCTHFVVVDNLLLGDGRYESWFSS